MQAGGRGDPIVLLGVAQRTGTHYLYDALLLHEQVAAASETHDDDRASWEDHLLSEADGLLAYANRVASHWNLDPAARASAHAQLVRSLGDGIVTFLGDRAAAGGATADQRPLVKTPTLDNLDLIEHLAPVSSVVVIVRDPRAVLASSLASFGRPPERWIRVWKRNAQILLRFMDRHPDHLTVVRYEDLYTDPANTMKGVLDHLGLDPTHYDFDALSRLPVRGSSQLGASGWHAVTPGPRFDPLARAEALSARLRRRTDWLLATEMSKLGYGTVRPLPSWRHVTQRLLDLRWAIAHSGTRAARAVRAAHSEYQRDRTRVIETGAQSLEAPQGNRRERVELPETG